MIKIDDHYEDGCDKHSIFVKDCLGCNPRGEDNAYYIPVKVDPEMSRSLSERMMEQFNNESLTDDLEEV